MQRSSSFVILDSEGSSPEHEYILKYPNDMPGEGLTFHISPTLDKSQYKSDIQSQETSDSQDNAKSSISDQDSCSTSADECADIPEIDIDRSRQNSEVSNKSSLSSEEIVADPIRSSDECESRSDSKIDDSSKSNDDARAESLNSFQSTKLEPDQNSPPEVEPSTLESIEEPVNTTEVQIMRNPNANFFNRFVDLVVNVNGIIGHIDDTSKMIALSILLLAILIPATTVFMISSTTKVTQPASHAFDIERSSELIKCKSTLNWRQEKIEQLEAKLEKLKTTVKELQNNFGECRSTLSEYQEKNTKCSSSLKDTKKMLKLKEEQYENYRSKVLELQEKIISNQHEEDSDHSSFLQKAFDKIFGFPTGRKFREPRSKWKH